MVASKSRAFLRTLAQDRRHDDNDNNDDQRGNGKRQACAIEQQKELYTNGARRRTTTTTKPQNRVSAMLVGILVFALLQGQLLMFGGGEKRERSHPEPLQERLDAYANAPMQQQQQQQQQQLQAQKPNLSRIDRKKVLMETSRQSLANRISTAAQAATSNTASTKQDDSSISLITNVVQNSAKSMLASMEGRVAIFYNVYLPPQDQWRTPRSIKPALRRVLDQLMQIRESSVANVTIQYGLIGHNVSHERLCPPPFRCHRLIYQERGWEDVTMFYAQEYCQKHPDHTIVYMHNKGSLNNNRNNERIRRITTKAALSDPCVTMEGGDCNVCASQLQMSPFFHYPANIWTAKCSYVAKLVPVQQYSQLRTQMCQDLHDWDQDETCNMTLLEGADAKAFAQRVGLGRHAVERWIVGHPSLIPCEVFPHTYLSQVQDGATDWTPVHKKLGPLYQRQPKWIWRSLRFLLKEFYYVYGQIQFSEEEQQQQQGFCPQMFRNLLPENPCLWKFPNITPLTERAKNK